MHFNFGYNYLWKDIMHYNVHYEYLYNALYIKALSKVLQPTLRVFLFVFLQSLLRSEAKYKLILSRQIRSILFSNSEKLNKIRISKCFIVDIWVGKSIKVQTNIVLLKEKYLIYYKNTFLTNIVKVDIFFIKFCWEVKWSTNRKM